MIEWSVRLVDLLWGVEYGFDGVEVWCIDVLKVVLFVCEGYGGIC